MGHRRNARAATAALVLLLAAVLASAIAGGASAGDGPDPAAINALVQKQMAGGEASGGKVLRVSGQAYIPQDAMDSGTISEALGALLDSQKGEGRAVAVQQAPRINFEIHFQKNSAELTSESQQSLDELAAALEADYPDLRFVLGGHTDQDGDDVINQPLSQARAESARAYLVEQHDIAPDRIEAQGFGAAEPLREVEESAQDKLFNRRVDLRPIF